ncbi:hypothetical protein N9Z44_01120 [Mariniblastus sp.]|nr:hypothetical protein [Mariniblastus sp.]MDB4370681.1 hypothetical protein [Mariniblastus sp.]
MRIKHSTPEDRPKWTDRAKNPTRDTERKGLGGLTKIRIVDEKPAEHETNQESNTSDD